MKEQTNATIYLSGDSSKELATVPAWRNSATVVWIHVPYYVASLAFKVGDAAATRYLYSLAGTYHPTRGLWRVYIPASRLSFAGNTYYKVVTADADGARTVGGEGVIKVIAGKIDDPDDEVARRAAVYCADTGKWYGVSVTRDTAGAPAFAVDEDAPLDAEAYEGAGEQAYAYNDATGLYHAVTAVVDDSGHVALRCAYDGVEGGKEAFAYSGDTGLWYRIEAKEDATGNTTLCTGETL